MEIDDDQIGLSEFLFKLLNVFNDESVIKRMDNISYLLSKETYKNCQEYYDFFYNFSYRDLDELVNDKNENCDLLTNESMHLLKEYIEKVYRDTEVVIDEERLETLNECYQVYSIGAYKACALLILSQIEGVINQCIIYKEKLCKKDPVLGKKKSLNGLDDKKKKLYSYDENMHDPFPAFKNSFENLVALERNSMSHDGIISNAKIKSFFFLLILLSVAGNVRYIVKKL